VDDRERREMPFRAERRERVEDAADLGVSVCVDLRAQKRVDRVQCEERDLVLDDDLLE
jgi:hypothetical protein